jgi:hypothetical protein
MAYQPYSDRGLAALLVLLFRVEDPDAQPPAPFVDFAAQLASFKEFYDGATEQQQQNHEFLKYVKKIETASSDADIQPLISAAHANIVALMNKLVEKQLWGVCGAIKRDKVLEIAGFGD